MVEFSYRNTFFILVFSLLSACSPFSSKQPSVVLIMVESFSEQNFLCADQEMIASLENLKSSCENIFRFTHVFSPTDLTQPNISSLFSQLPVQEHGVMHNGNNALSSKVTTLAELALLNKMRTGFFSGGVPLLPKFGITQGFETFNDSFGDKSKFDFRSFDKTISKALTWIDAEVKSRPYFLSLYAPDLLYKDRVTIGPEGNERPTNRRSQLQHLFESMDALIGELKKRDTWSNTHVVFVGLGGQKKRLGTHNELNSGRYRVPLQIKLADKVSIDLSKFKEGLMSLDLVGSWVSALIKNDLNDPDKELPQLVLGEFIPQESHWKKWLNLSNISFYGLRTRRFLFRLTSRLRVYDSFEDRLEYNELSPSVSGPIVLQFKVKEKLGKYFKDPCILSNNVKTSSCKQVKNGMNDFTLLEQMDDLSKKLDSDESAQLSSLVTKAIQEDDMKIIGWLAYKSLYYKKWDSLFELGKKVQNQAWMLVAQANLREKPVLSSVGCFKYFIEESSKTDNFYQHCQDSALRKVVEGFSQLRNKKRPSVSFWNQVHQIKKRRYALVANQKMKYINDVINPFDFSPSLAELYFFLPDNSIYQKLIEG